MCDYSLHCVESRSARIDDKLMMTKFAGTQTRGFAAADNSALAVCLRPGTELVFERPVEYRGWYGQMFPFLRNKITGRLARFRKIDTERLCVHHDALEFEDGTIVLLTSLCVGQGATILQMPSEPDRSQVERQKHSTAGNELIELR